MKYEQVENGYVIAVGDSIVGEEITEKEFKEILEKIKSSPRDPNGYQYKLRADTLEWELVELPPAPEPSEDPAEIEDYENALVEMGVDLNGD